MKTPVLHFMFLALLGSFLTPLAVAYASPSPADSVHFSCQIIDPEEWERDQPLPAAKRTDLDVGEPRTVRLIYFLPDGQSYRAETVEAMKTGILEIQSFFDEQMAAHGHGNKTFQIETDDQGEPIVHRVDGGIIGQTFDLRTNIYLIVNDQTAGVHGSGFYFGKNSGIAKIFYGWDWFAAAHELGHALGLHHDFRDNTYIMSYGRMDRLSAQLSECTAEYLAANPHFNLDIPTEEAPPPTIELISSPNYPVGSNSVPVQLRVRDAEGLYQVLLNSSGQRGTELITCRGLTGETDTVVEFDYDGVIPSFARTSLSDPALHSIYVAAVDIAGNMSEASFALAETSPQHIATLEGHTQSVYSVAFSPNGTILASASRDSTVKLWNVSTRAHSATLRHGENVTSVSFSPDGTTLASGARDVKLWNVSTKENVATLEGHLAVGSVAFSPDGTTLASVDRSSLLKLWDVATGTNIATFDDAGSGSVAFSSDGMTLASPGDYSNRTSIKLWDVVTRTHIATIDNPWLGSVFSVAFSSDGSILASGQGNAIYLWDVATRTKIATLTGHTSFPNSVAFSSDETILASASYDNTVRLWDVSEWTGDPVTISLEKVGESQFKAVASTGIPFDIVLPLSVTNGTIDGGANSITIPTGSVESESLTVTRTPGTTLAVIVDIGTLPELPADSGYELFKSIDLPLVFTELGGTFFIPVSERTPQVRDAIVATLGVSSANDVTEADLAAITSLNLSNESITSLNAGDFSGLSSLTSLWLNANDLTALPDRIFDNLNTLRNLNLQQNELRSLPAGIFDNLNALTTLILAENGLSSLPAGIFDNLNALTTLRLDWTALTTLPAGIFDNLNALTELRLYNSQLSTLPAGLFDNLNALRNLNLERNELGSLPAGIFDNLNALTTLNLNYNQLSSLPADIFDELTALSYLFLDSNQLSSLPAGIFDNLNTLRYLNLQSNQLSSLPAGIFDNLNTLTRLYLYSNQLSSLPAGLFDNLTALPSINLSRNQLSSLPAGIFDNLNTLTALILAENQLSSLPAGIFDGLTALTSLDLQSNLINPLPLTVSLEKIGNGQFKAVAPSGAPFDIVLPLNVINGSINGGASSITIPKGSLESQPLTVTHTSGTPFAVAVDISTLPGLPTDVDSRNRLLHTGYTLAKSDDLPLAFPELGGIVFTFTPLSERTPQVRDAIVAAVPGISDYRDVTDAHLTDIHSLDLDSQNITALKAKDFDGLTALTTLHLQSNQLSSLPADLFDGLTALTTLHLQSNQLSSLPADLFDGLTALTTLHLQSNQLSSLPADLFDGLTALTTLHLQSNQLSSLPADLFDGLTALTTLHLQSNQLSSLPADLFDGLTTLTTLHLQSNQLTTLPADLFDGLTALTTLHLQSNQLSSLPVGIFDGLTALTTLHLQSNAVNPLPLTVSLEKVGEGQFKAVAPTGAPFELVLPVSVSGPGAIEGGATTITIPIGNLESAPLTVPRTPGTTAAVTVDIGNLPSLPPVEHEGYSLVKSEDLPLLVWEDITGICDRTPQVRDAIVAAVSNVSTCGDVRGGHLAAIYSLNLPNKSITSLKADDFDGLTRLTGLHLSYNQLSSLPAGIFDNLTALRTFTLYSNQLSSLPAGLFDNLTALTQLHLPYNQLSSLPAGIFDNLTALTTLNLQSNQLSSLPAGLFDNLTALQRLELRENALTTLPAGLFDNLTALPTLNLSSNQLTALPEGIFDTLTNLTDLSLSSNQLTALPAGLFDNLTALTTLSLFGNQLSSLPAGIFDNLTALTRLDLQSNPVNPLPLTVSLEKVGNGQFKAVAPTGAPFDIVLPLNVMNGTINGGASSVTIPKGNVESQPLTATRTPGTTAAVTVDIGTLPGLPTNHSGYAFVKSTDLPLEIWAGESTLVCDRTPQVRDAIVAAVPNVSTCGDVTEAHLAAITELELELEGQSIPALQVGDFDGLTALTSLDLDSNQLTSLPEGIFDNLTALRHLYLTDNQLTAVPEGTFDNLGVLETLYLTNNQLTALPEGIDNLTTLTRLALNSNPLTALPEGIFDKLTNLTHLDLAGSQLTTLPVGIDKLTNLTSLDLAINQLTALPVGIDKLTNLTDLGLDRNQLTSLPVGIFDNLTNLTGLDLAGNQLTALPVGIFDKLTNLTQLYLDNNQLTALPEGIFGNLNALTTLHLDGNQLTALPEGIFDGISLLTTLTLYNGPVDPLPLMVSLEKVGEDQVKAVAPSGVPFDMVLPLSVASGSISGDATTITIPVGSVESQPLTVMRTPSTTAAVTVDIGTLPGLPSNHQGYAPVKSADLPLTVIDPLAGAITPVCDRTPQVRDAIVATAPVSACGDVAEAHLASITQLYLYEEKIRTLKPGDFDGLTVLTTLRLDGNELSSLPEGVFDNNTALTQLFLHDNQLSSLPAGIFENNTALTTLYLHTNQLSSLPAGIFENNTALTSLTLRTNQLSSLPEGVFDNNTVLTQLFLHDNQLSSLPEGVFNNNTVLTQLYLHTNQLSLLPEGIFDNNTVLTELHLYTNQLGSLPEGIFDNNTALTWLTLSGNQLSSLPAGIFDNNTALTQLSLGTNKLSSLPEGIFENLTALTHLYMDQNQLSSLPAGIFKNLIALTHLAVDSLPLIVSLEKVGTDQFKAVAPTGAPFELVLPLTVANGSISGGATTITILAGSVESEPLTVTRTPGSTFAVTVDIGTLPGLPNSHRGYALVKSADLPLKVTEGDIIGDTLAFTMTVGRLGENTPYPTDRFGFNRPRSPFSPHGSLSTQTFNFKGITYTVTALYYDIYHNTRFTTREKYLFFETIPLFPRGFVLYLDSQQFNSAACWYLPLFGNRGWNRWDNVDLNWSTGQTVRVRVVETTPMPPGVPINLQATTHFKNVTLTWEPPVDADPISLPIEEYELRISDDGGTSWDPDWNDIYESGSGERNRSSVTIGRDSDNYYAFSNGTEYTIEVRAKGGDGSGDAERVTLIMDGITSMDERTPQVRDAIVAAVPGVNSADDVTEAHLAAITTFNLGGRSITALKAGDFDGLNALTSLSLSDNQLSSLPRASLTTSTR